MIAYESVLVQLLRLVERIPTPRCRRREAEGGPSSTRIGSS
jgi:hypothetical protein